MSTNQRKRRREADDSGPAQKQRRLLPSSMGEASESEPAGLAESGTLVSDVAGGEIIGATADSPESKDINVTGNDSGNAVQGEQSEQHPLVSRAAADSVVLLASVNDEQPSSSLASRDGAPPRDMGSSPRDSDGLFGPLISVLHAYCFLQLLGGSLMDRSVLSDDDKDEATDDDVSMTDLASEEGDSSKEKTESSDAWPPATVRCPICMDFYPEIVHSGRLLLSTLCGHVFCSQCLPAALETASSCPLCWADLTAGQYHPIYI